MATARKSKRASTKRSITAAAAGPGHDSFLQQLLNAFPNCVYLVGRCAGEDLGLGGDPALRVFFPDFHWMSRECRARYRGGYGFNGNAPSDRPLMATLLSLIGDARSAGAAVEVFQMGDRYDLWREMTPADSDILAAFDRVNGDPAVSGLAARLDQLETRYIRGNHDGWLRQVENRRPELRKSQVEIEAGGGKILLVHGHQFDSVERILPDEVKAAFVGLAPNLRPGTYDVGPFPNATITRIQKRLDLRNRLRRPDIYPVVAPAGARLLKSLQDIETIEADSKTCLDVTIFSHGSESANDFEHISYLAFADQTLTYERNHPSDHTVHVIGHTHHARILLDRAPDKPLPHVTVDCGGWVENCIVRSGPNDHASVAPSAQFAVQFENDIRIYQLTPSSTFPV